MRVDLFDFELPEDLIALRPARPRDSARLLHAPVRGAFEDRVVSDAPALFRAGDLLVFNDTRVIPARLKGERHRGESIVEIEATLLRRMSPSLWSALAKPGKRLKEGDRVHFSAGEGRSQHLGTWDATVASKDESGVVVLRFDLTGPGFDQLLAAVGEMPLPPYIAGRRSDVRAEAGGTDIFITPGYRFRVVDGLWTNFHLPRSTLFMLVSAFAGLERMQAVYAHAIANGYRFYSYGDASLLWRAE
ncbi:MAG: S-adenosylmethionine:tRNA ribosyltransferase-isomerase [Caulobacteraceae bacterium]|nr:S-adenosylmethionine:tRNA ribosyltransferase-isomerase [Caulobacteraceae bacterium]